METREEHSVIECTECGLARLSKFFDTSSFYTSSEYRKAYNGSMEVENYFRLHDCEQSKRVERIQVDSLRGKTVLDFGCGGGSFLDLIKGIAQKTFGVEPCTEYHKSLKERSHDVYASAANALETLEGRLDCVVSFGVIEHVPNPLEYLEQARRLLKPNGLLILETDNRDDILMKLGIPEFDRFFYRTAHLWYFNSGAIEKLCSKAGFNIQSVKGLHTYDLSNTMAWLRDRKPTGTGKITLFDERLNESWRSFLESNNMGDLIWVKALRPS